MGVSREAVRKAIPRIRPAVVYVDGVPKIADPALARHLWAANTDLSRAPDRVKLQAALRAAKTGGATPTRLGADAPQGSQPGAAPRTPGERLEPQPHGGALRRLIPAEDGEPASALAGASAREKHWRAQTAELKYRHLAGELQNAAEYRALVVNGITEVRTIILGVPSKFKQRHPELTLEQLETLDALLREALEACARIPQALGPPPQSTVTTEASDVPGQHP